MQLVMKLKPMKFSAPTKWALDNLIRHTTGAFWSAGSIRESSRVSQWACLRNDKGQFVLVSYQKYRRKSRVMRNLVVAGQKGPTHARIPVRPAYWEAHVYMISATWVHLARQYKRNFTLQLHSL
jgi:hypothetical protein